MDQPSLFNTGKPIAISGRRSKLRKVSRDATECQRCGVALPPRTRAVGLPRKWCAECAEIARRGKGREPKSPVTKSCVCCGIEITGPAHKRWCSPRCARLKRYRLNVVHWTPPRIAEPPNTHCLNCGAELPPKKGRGPQRKWCSPKCAPWYGQRAPKRRIWFAGHCAECGGSFVTNQPQAQYCSDRCVRRRAERHKWQRRRARKEGNGAFETIDIRQIAERDKWTCHLCRQPVTRETWSLDHLHPLSQGGEHTSANVAIAHRLCNAIRSDMPLKETQRIIEAAHAALEEGATC